MDNRTSGRLFLVLSRFPARFQCKQELFGQARRLGVQADHIGFIMKNERDKSASAMMIDDSFCKRDYDEKENEANGIDMIFVHNENINVEEMPDRNETTFHQN